MRWLGGAAFGVALALMMWAPVPDVVDLALPAGEGATRAVEFAYSSHPAHGGLHHAVVGVKLSGSPAWDSVLLRLGTYDTSPRVRSATLEAAGCVIARAHGEIGNNQLTEFKRTQSRCDPTLQSPIAR